MYGIKARTEMRRGPTLSYEPIYNDSRLSRKNVTSPAMPITPSSPNTRLFEELLETMATLRGPQGCPWDKKQTHQSLSHCLLEETYEVLEAIDRQDPILLQEELGDLLLQVVFHSQIAKESETFEMENVLRGLIQKLKRRHPHVFSDEKIQHAEAAIQRWEKIKSQEKGKNYSLLSGIPKELPALLKAYRMGSKAARVGFDWPDVEGVLGKVDEELKELHEEINRKDTAAIEEEFGDLLFSLAQVARFLKVNPEDALRKSTTKFQRRFSAIEQRLKEDGKNITECTPEELEKLWEASKSSTNSVKNL